MSEKKSPDEKPIIKKPIEKAYSDLGDAKNHINGPDPLAKNTDKPGEKITKPTEIRGKHEE